MRLQAGAGGSYGASGCLVNVICRNLPGKITLQKWRGLTGNCTDGEAAVIRAGVLAAIRFYMRQKMQQALALKEQSQSQAGCCSLLEL
jgi:hypothetical protein